MVFLVGREAVWAGQPGGPFGGFAEVGELGDDVGADGILEGDDFVQDPERVLAHFFAGEQFGQVGGSPFLRRRTLSSSVMSRSRISATRIVGRVDDDAVNLAGVN